MVVTMVLRQSLTLSMCSVCLFRAPCFQTVCIFHDGNLAVPARYSRRQMAAATDNWSDSNLLGSGGFGKVYKGRDPNNPEILWTVTRSYSGITEEVREKRVAAEGRVGPLG